MEITAGRRGTAFTTKQIHARPAGHPAENERPEVGGRQDAPAHGPIPCPARSSGKPTYRSGVAGEIGIVLQRHPRVLDFE